MNLYLVNQGKHGQYFFDSFSAEATRRGMSARKLDSRDCILHLTPKNVRLVTENNVIDFSDSRFFIRSYKSDAYFTYLIAKVLDAHQILYTDPANLLSQNTADKMTLMVILALMGTRIPCSFLCTPHSFRRNRNYILENTDFPCVVKKSGSKGQNVWKVETEANLVEQLTQDDELTLIQEYIKNDHDYRVFVVEDTVIAAVKRISNDGFYNNISQGGRGEKATLTSKEKAICVAATQAAGLNISGVDFIRSNGETVLLEVNKNPQLEIFNEIAGVNLADAVCERVITRLLD